MTRESRVAVMERAHEIAAKLEGNYSARMSDALKQAWAEYREWKNSYRKVIMPKWLFDKKHIVFGKYVHGGMAISGLVVRETEKAILLKCGYDQYWLPKSQIKIIATVA